jgi:hypothetical protein
MEQSELERLRAEKAQMCQQLADATAALDKVASSVRDLPNPTSALSRFRRREKPINAGLSERAAALWC